MVRKIQFCSSFKKILIFPQKKAFLIFSQMKPNSLQIKLAKKKKKEIHPRKNF